MDESAVSWRHLQLALLVDHLTPGDSDYGHTVALHALEDVVVHRLVVRLGWDFSIERQIQDIVGQLIMKHFARSVAMPGSEYFTSIDFLHAGNQCL